MNDGANLGILKLEPGVFLVKRDTPVADAELGLWSQVTVEETDRQNWILAIFATKKPFDEYVICKN